MKRGLLVNNKQRYYAWIYLLYKWVYPIIKLCVIAKKRRATGKYSRNSVCPTDDSILSCWLDKKERFGWSSKNENIRKMVNVKFKQKFT